MAEQFEIKQLIDDFASDLAGAVPVDQWGRWLVYLAECLESEAYKRPSTEFPLDVEREFGLVVDGLADRLKAGRW